MAKLSPFEFINSINNKNPIDRELIDEYTPFIVNRGLSYFNDCIHYVNEMNKYHFLDKDQQYLFLYKVIKKGKRFSKWIKKQDEHLLNVVCAYYQVNQKRGMDILDLLDEDQKLNLVEIMSFGGTVKKKNTK